MSVLNVAGFLVFCVRFCVCCDVRGGLDFPMRLPAECVDQNRLVLSNVVFGTEKTEIISVSVLVIVGYRFVFFCACL